jgi:hypothetical protein
MAYRLGKGIGKYEASRRMAQNQWLSPNHKKKVGCFWIEGFGNSFLGKDATMRDLKWGALPIGFHRTFAQLHDTRLHSLASMHLHAPDLGTRPTEAQLESQRNCSDSLQRERREYAELSTICIAVTL